MPYVPRASPRAPRLIGAALAACAAFSACEARAPQPPPPPPLPAPAPAPPAETAAASATPGASAAPTPAYPPPPPPSPPIVLHAGGKHAVRGDAGLVTSVEANATVAGAEVLRRGGNAVDAAVTVAFTLAVTHPSA